jgi:hypothetical protein
LQYLKEAKDSSNYESAIESIQEYRAKWGIHQ